MTTVALRQGKKGVIISVKVRPGASRKGIVGMEGETLNVRLTAHPVDGAANEQLIELLAEEFCVRRSAIKIIKGHTSRNKTVEIEGVTGLELKENK